MMGVEGPEVLFSKSLQWHEGNENNNYSNLILYFYICALTLAIKAKDLQYSVCARNASILFSTLAEKIHPITCHVIVYALNAKVVFFFSCTGVYKVALMHLEPCEGKLLFLAKCQTYQITESISFILGHWTLFRMQEG